MKKLLFLPIFFLAGLFLSRYINDNLDYFLMSPADKEIQEATFYGIPNSGIMVSELSDDEQKTFIFSKTKNYKGYEYYEIFKASVNCVSKKVKLTQALNSETVHFFWEEVKSGTTIPKKDEQALIKHFCR